MAAFRRLRQLLAATGGASTIEFAIVGTFLIVPLVLGTYDFGTALYDKLQVGNAARAGAQYLNVHGYSSADSTVTLACQGANFTCAVQSATPLGNNVSVSVSSPYCGCQTGASYTAATFSPPCNVCAASGGSNCCPNGQTAVTLAKVNASYTYHPIFSYLGFGPSNGFGLSGSATALIY